MSHKIPDLVLQERTLRTPNREGTIPVPDGLILHDVDRVRWKTPDQGVELSSSDVRYTDLSNQRPEYESSPCFILVNLRTGEYCIRKDNMGRPWSIDYVLAEMVT